jgi:hypothetical protein
MSLLLRTIRPCKSTAVATGLALQRRWLQTTQSLHGAATTTSTHEPSNVRVIVVLLGWLQCKQRHLQRYSRIYTSLPSTVATQVTTLSIIPPWTTLYAASSHNQSTHSSLTDECDTSVSESIAQRYARNVIQQIEQAQQQV